MHIIKVGMSYHEAPIDIREKVTFTSETARKAMGALIGQATISENVIFSTCNRTEIYAVVLDVEVGTRKIIQFLEEWFHVTRGTDMSYFASASDENAVEHLFRLTSGLESMVIGETQILGQVRSAFANAQAAKTTGKILNELFKRTITFAKHVHQHTDVGRHAVSVSYVAVELAKRTLGGIKDKHVLIIGAGEMGELSMKNLQGAGAGELTVMNRTLERAKALANAFQAHAVSYSHLTETISIADIVITSTASSQPVLTHELLHGIMEKRDGKPLCLIDMAVPRDIDPKVKELDHVSLYDMDDLQLITGENMATRKKAASEVANDITEERSSFYTWVAMQDAVPTIKALKEKSARIQASILTSIQQKIPDLTERETKVITKHMHSVAHQLLDEPIKKVKTMGHSKEELDLFADIFGLNKEDNNNHTV